MTAKAVFQRAATMVARNTVQPTTSVDGHGNVCVLEAIGRAKTELGFAGNMGNYFNMINAAAKRRSGGELGIIPYQNALTPLEASAFLFAIAEEA